jgi:hypothetical protein
VASEFRVEKSQTGYRVALYRDGKYDVTFVEGLTLAAARRQALSLTAFWRRIRSGAGGCEVPRFEQAS